MNNTIGFPPADALLNKIASIHYHKHAKQFLMLTVTVIAIVVASSQFIFNKAAQWYTQGGKELLLNYTHRAVLFINNKTKLFDKLYAAMIALYNRIERIAHAIDDVTVC